MASAFNAAVGYVNLFDSGVVSATSAQILTPPSILQDPHVSRVWRGANGTTDSIIVDLGSAQTIDTIYGMGSNLTAAGTVRLRLSLTDSSGVTGEVYDSGTLSGRVDPNYGYVPFALSATHSARYIRLDFADVTLSAIELGRMFIGLRTQFLINFDYGWQAQRNDRSAKAKTRGGQTQVFRDNAFRSFELPMNFVNPTDRYGVVEAMDIVNGASTDVLFVLDPTSTNLGRDSVWGLVSELTAVVQAGFEYFSKTYKIEERL